MAVQPKKQKKNTCNGSVLKLLPRGFLWRELGGRAERMRLRLETCVMSLFIHVYSGCTAFFSPFPYCLNIKLHWDGRMGFSLQSHGMFRIRLTQAHYRVVYTYTQIFEGIFQHLFLVKHLQKASIRIIPFVLIRNIGAVHFSTTQCFECISVRSHA